MSWGGFVCLRFAALAPTRVERLALLVPAGVVNGPLWAGFSTVFWPIQRYRWSPTPARLAAATRHLLTTHDDDWVPYLGVVLTAFTPNMKIPRRAPPDELAALTVPVLAVAADGDLSFPGEPLLARARQLLRGPLETELLEGVRHRPPTTDAFRPWMTGRLERFLTGGGGA